METITSETNLSTVDKSKDEQQHDEPSTMRIVVAIDESDESFYVLKWVLEKFFRHSPTYATPELNQNRLTIIHVMHRYPQYVFPGAPAVIPAVSTANRGQQESATILVSQAVGICKEKKVEVETIILEGDAKEAICQATEEIDIDLLVVGSRRHGKIKRAFLGSVSDYCAHHAKCPVLIVKLPKEMTRK